MNETGQQHFEFYSEIYGTTGEGEAQSGVFEESKADTASKTTDPKTAYLMEQAVEKTNLKKALKQVRANKGSAGADGMTVDQLGPYLREHWPKLKGELLTGKYRPKPVKRVEIAKAGRGRRQLGVPTVPDRFIQQAILQALTPLFDPTFSEYSYGFRPGRSAHQAVKAAQRHLNGGSRWVVDLDIEKFFDRVNHDVLMGKIAKRIEDKRLLKLLRLYLQAGVMINGVVIERTEGTPQGGPLSPLLSNIMLDELDKELERRGHKFSRYADDCNIYVQSKRAGERVMESVKKFLQRRLRLKVNETKSAVAPAGKRKFLGFSIWWKGEAKVGIARKSIERAKVKIRKITGRTRGISLDRMIKQLNQFTTGWVGYFRITEGPGRLQEVDRWIYRRLRCFKIKQWKNRARTRFRELTKLGLDRGNAAIFASSRRSWWALSKTPQMSMAMPAAYFQQQGLMSLFQRYVQLQSN